MKYSSRATRFMLISCLSALLFSNPWAAFSQDVKPFIGTWKGSIEAVGQKFEIIVKFTLDEEGNVKGTIDIPQQGLSGFALNGIEIDGKKITFIMSTPGEPTFKGELDDSGAKITGNFFHGGAEGTFGLEKE